MHGHFKRTGILLCAVDFSTKRDGARLQPSRRAQSGELGTLRFRFVKIPLAERTAFCPLKGAGYVGKSVPQKF